MFTDNKISIFIKKHKNTSKMAHSITVNQEEKALRTAQNLFEQKVTDDFTHFEFMGLRLNFNTMNVQCIFEIHSEEGSFNCFLDLNEKKQVLKKSFTLETI